MIGQIQRESKYCTR